MSSQRPKILVAKIGGHRVTMTNRKAGTMLVSERAYRTFRQILVDREIVTKEDTQSDVLSELGECIDAASWLHGRDRNGNLLLLDIDMNIMFIVEDEGRILLHSYEKPKRSKGQMAKKTARSESAA